MQTGLVTENIMKTQEVVAALMEKVYGLRLHKNRNVLVKSVRVIKPDASMESIMRAQRKIWQNTLGQLRHGTARYAEKYLPKGKDFKEWCDHRKISEEAYRHYAKRMS